MSNLKAIHEATRLQPINKLMVVGHPLSGYAAVEQVLLVYLELHSRVATAVLV
jgi:hypothetical protein